MREATQHNRFELLIDEEFFKRVHLLLSQLEQTPAAANTYVLIGLWCADLTAKFPACATANRPQRTFQQILQALETAGHKVSVILWAGSTAPGVTGAKERTKALAIQRWARNKQHVKVYLEGYKSSFAGISLFGVGSSQHQKIVICSFAGELRAVVGGFNFGTEYCSKPDHADEGEYWHDTAAFIEGPAAAVVHNEWCRRWSKGGEQPGAVATVDPATYPRKGNSAITIGTTNTEVRTWSQMAWGIGSFGYWSGRENHIREMMIERIDAAEQYIYIEGYAFTDPALVTALQRKLRDTQIPVVVLINHPQNELFWANTTWSYYHYYTFVQLAVPRATRITVSTSDGEQTDRRTLVAGDPSSQRERVKFFMPESDGEFWWKDGEGWKWRAMMTHIESIVGPPVMYGARTRNTRTSQAGAKFRCWPYPHSKLAIFDDRYMFVGSSNWTYRSMEYDGEITALIDDRHEVRRCREALISHWWGGAATTVEEWIARSADNDAVRDDPLDATRPGLHVMRLRYEDFLNPKTLSLQERKKYDAIWKMF